MRIGIFFGVGPALSGACRWPCYPTFGLRLIRFILCLLFPSWWAPRLGPSPHSQFWIRKDLEKGTWVSRSTSKCYGELIIGSIRSF